tara:strand:- start:687 stop:2426 length:1740 start_codon:yes stop_codon:yes gene_type:complete
MLSDLKTLLGEKINRFYLIILLNITAIFFELLSIASIPFFIGSIFNPEIIINNFYNLNLDKLLKFNLKNEDIFVYSSIFLVLSFTLKNFFLIFIYIFQDTFLKDIKINLEKKIFNYYLTSSYINQLRNNPAGILRNINDEVMNFYNYINYLFLFTREIFTLILIFAIFSFTNFKAALFITIILSIIIFFYLKFVKPTVKKRATKNLFFRKKIAQIILETFRSIQDIKIYKKESFVNDIFQNNAKKLEHNHYIFSIISKLPRIILEVIVVILGLISVIFILNTEIKFNNQILPLLALFVIGMVRFIPAFNSVTVSINYLKVFKASVLLLSSELKYLFNNERKNKKLNYDFQKNSKNKSYLYLDKIEFEYNKDKPIFSKILNLQIKKGKKIAIMGKSGSGKSTLLHIITGLLNPKKGNVFFEGINIKTLDKNWNSKISYVSQNIFLFNSSIINNITMYEKKNMINYKRLKLSLKISNLDKTINNLKNGLETIIGVDSLNFSGGEKQRIAIARAVYKFPEILILDEFTSAIDDETKNIIIKGLFSIFNKKNIILITHDTKVANKCDQLYYLKEGYLKIKNIK